jgi:integrase
VKVPRKAPQPVPLESFERLLQKAPDLQMRTYLLCGWLAGLRLNEALDLEREESAKVPWVDFPRNRIVLPAEFVKAVADQWVPLDPELRAALESLPRHGRKVFRFVGEKGKNKGEVLDGNAVSQRVAALAKKAGVRLTMKALRRGFGCRYAGKVSAHVLQRLMRHATLKTTMDYYVNIDQAVEDAVLGPGRNTSRNSAGSAEVPGQLPATLNPSDQSTNSPSAS